MRQLSLSVLLCLLSGAAWGADVKDLAPCVDIASDAERLACYDKIAGRRTEPTTAKPSPLAERWELEPSTNRGTFGFRPYRQNYILLARVTDRENDRPFRSNDTPATEDLTLDRNEIKYQLSFKTKAWDNIFGSKSDLWFAYTQQSHWQVFNGSVSRPFRETNYEPEIVWVTPLTFALGGFKVRYGALGINHQSNGRSDPLSRSWNRVFAEVGGEYGDFALWVRPWWRIPESPEKDDNPDITKFIGRGEIVGVYKFGRHTFSAVVRNNFSFGNNRGSVLADWSFPLVADLKGYVQVFSGYGESLIDYNWRQTTFGIGVLLTDRL